MKKSHTVRPEKPKSSPEARRLLDAAYKLEGSWPKVAKRFGLTPSAAWQMAKGKLADTRRMKVVIRNARRRSEKSFLGYRVKETEQPINQTILKQSLHSLKMIEKQLVQLMNGDHDAEPNPNPTTD